MYIYICIVNSPNRGTAVQTSTQIHPDCRTPQKVPLILGNPTPINHSTIPVSIYIYMHMYIYIDMFVYIYELMSIFDELRDN